MSKPQLEILNTLLEAGCCKRCAIRYVTLIDGTLEDPDLFIRKLIKTEEDEEIKHLDKRQKKNPCCVCLDLLDDSFLDGIMNAPFLNNIKEYDCDTFKPTLNIPASIMIRDSIIGIYITEKYPTFFTDDTASVRIKRACTLVIQSKLEKKLNKTYDKNSPLEVIFVIKYAGDEQETRELLKLDKFKKMADKPIEQLMSKNTIEFFLKETLPEELKKLFQFPPLVPETGVVFEEGDSLHTPIYIAGRYCKYSRKLGQTPFEVDNVKIWELSVQDVIFTALKKSIKSHDLVFSASGREDSDVRTLGDGRPFYVKIVNPVTSKIAFETFRNIESDIKSSNLVSVKYLQLVDKNDVNKIKLGEQFKKKSYRALCVIDNPDNLDNYIKIINTEGQKVFEIHQKTPFRVLHRRSAAVRIKQIYQMEAQVVPGQPTLFTLDVITEAGTYVKEFVHGDLARTKNCLKSIIGGNVDILALDVMQVFLDFPPAI